MTDDVSKQSTDRDDFVDSETMLDSDTPFDKLVLFAFDEACQKLGQASELEPFTVVISGDDLYIESHPGENIVECFNSARQAIKLMSSLAEAYVFCYDGYVRLDEETRDAVIAERAQKDDETGEAFALFYRIDESGEGSVEFEQAIISLGEAPSLFTAGEFDENQLEGFDDTGPDPLDLAQEELLDMAMTDDIEQVISTNLLFSMLND